MSKFMSFVFVFLFTTLLYYSRLTTSLSDPDPAPIQTQILYPYPPATIPAFPEQSAASACPLNLPDDLFQGIRSACGSKPHHRPDTKSFSGQLHRSRCCPVLAAYLYSAYSETALRSSIVKAPQQTAPYDMPVLPDDSETCVDTLERALGNRGIELGKPNETCDVVYCYCGIRLHPFSCPEAFSLNSGGQLTGNKAVQQLEKDCVDGGLAGCSKCLNTLQLLTADKAAEKTNRTDRTIKMRNRDCELMGLTWLLNKDRSAYIRPVSAVLRAIMMSKEGTSDVCRLNSDGMPLAVDSSEINNQSSSSITALRFHHHFIPLSLLGVSILFLFARY